MHALEKESPTLLFWNDRCLIEAVSDLKHKKVIQSLALFMFIISKPLRK